MPLLLPVLGVLLAPISAPPVPTLHRPPAALLEVAPGELGKARSRDQLLLAGSPSGKILYLLDGSGRLTAYLENGANSGEVVTLHAQGFSISDKPFWFAVSSSEVAVATPLDVTAFRLDGTWIAERRALFMAGSIAALPSGDWGLGLMQSPQGPHFSPAEEVSLDAQGRYSMKKGSPDSPRPRLISLNSHRLEVSDSGLLANKDGRSISQAAGRSLSVVAGGRHVYAVELANYKIYELDGRLKLRSTLSDPHRQLDKGLPGLVSEKEKAENEAKIRAEGKVLLDRSGRDVASPSTAPARTEAVSFDYTTVVQAAGFDLHTGRLILLLDQGIAAPGYALDLVDPATGEVSRLALRLPESEAASPAPIGQMVVGNRYLWFRGRPGQARTLRLDCMELERAKPVGKLVLEP
jgi:hypothetical protein